MRVVHDPSGDRTALATTVETAATFREQFRGLMFRDAIPDDYALVFDFDDPPGWIPEPLVHWRTVHMLFVRQPLDVLWIRDGAVTKATTLPPWVGFGVGKADTIVELPAGAADGVDVGDEVAFEDGDDQVEDGGDAAEHGVDAVEDGEDAVGNGDDADGERDGEGR